MDPLFFLLKPFFDTSFVEFPFGPRGPRVSQDISEVLRSMGVETDVPEAGNTNHSQI